MTEAPTCANPPVPASDPWNIDVRWESELEDWVCQNGSILLDVSGDGVSDILCNHYEEIIVVSGVDGTTLFTIPFGWRAFNGEIAAGDLNQDGEMEIVTILPDGTLVAYRTDFSILWTSSTLSQDRYDTLVFEIGIEIVDLDADGRIEVVTGKAVFAGEDGTRLFDFAFDSLPYGTSSLQILVADTDLDGSQEMIVGSNGFSPMGLPEWSAPLPSHIETVLALLLQADADEEAEVAIVGDGVLLVGDGTGTWASTTIGYRYPNICSGDTNGDGQAEVITFNDTTQEILCLSGDLSEEWSRPVEDMSSTSGCTTFDFDLDGRDEILTSDGSTLLLLDGSTGEALWTYAREGDPGFWTLPFVADLEGDGSVEIVYIAYGFTGYPVLTAFTHHDAAWPPGSRLWPSFNWSGTSLFTDGSIPRTQDPSWLVHNSYRAQPEWLPAGSDLRPEILDSCYDGCDGGEASLAVRVANLGPAEIRDGVSVSAFTLDEDGGWTLVDVLRFEGFLDNNQASATQEWAVDVAQARRGVRFVAGDDGDGVPDIEDCNMEDNIVEWRLADCD